MDNRIKSIEFIEDKHEYWFVDTLGHHRQLRGVTGAIGKLLNKAFPDTDTVRLATMYGSDVHKEVENYFNDNDFNFSDKKLSTEGATWIVKELIYFSYIEIEDYDHIECEVMVSDFVSTASKIDIVVYTKQNTAYLFDIKTTSVFDRQYCSYQLSVYKELFEKNYGIKVDGLYVLSTKKKRRFHILPQDSSLVEKILEKNKNNA